MSRITIGIITFAICLSNMAMGGEFNLFRNVPTWTKQPPSGSYYKYYTGYGESAENLLSAQKSALNSLYYSLSTEDRVWVQAENKSSLTEKRITSDDVTKTEISDEFVQNIITRGDFKEVQGLKKEDEYWYTSKVDGQKIYRYWVLMKVPKDMYKMIDPSLMVVDQSYGIWPIVKSIVLPGWGQFQKKESKKGTLLMSGFTASLTVALISQKLSQNYSVDAQNADSGEWINYYNTLSEQYYLAAVLSYILAGTIYGYSTYDAIASPGEKIYAGGDPLESLTPNPVFTDSSRQYSDTVQQREGLYDKK